MHPKHSSQDPLDISEFVSLTVRFSLFTKIRFHCRIENCTPGTYVPQLAVKSSPKEWEDSGKVLFENKHYLQAMHCFQRANLPTNVAVANAYYLRELAGNISSKSTHEYSKAFVKAGDAFVKCASTAVKQKRAYYRIAGDCYEQADDPCKAAKAFTHAEDFTYAIKLYHKAERFEEALEIVKVHHERIDTEFVNQVKDAARLFYFKLQKFQCVS
jgi:tetratricopeptide (TPR) repeat protein